MSDTLSPYDQQKNAIRDFIDGADVEKLHSVPEPSLEGGYGKRRSPEQHALFCASARRWLAEIGVANFAINSNDFESRQLNYVVTEILSGVRAKIAEFEQPFRQMLWEIDAPKRERRQAQQLAENERKHAQLEEDLANAKADRAAARKAFREKYGSECEGCGKRTGAVHPILDVLCCMECRTTRDEYKLIYRTTAKKEFGLRDCDLESLVYAEVVNQNYRSGPPASLFLRSEVQSLAISK